MKPQDLISIYDAAFAKDRWGGALDAFVNGSTAMGAMLYDVGDRREVSYSANATNDSFGLSARVIQDYNHMIQDGGGSGLDLEGATFMHGKPAFTPVLDEEVWAVDDRYIARPENQFVINRLGAFRRFFINLSEDPLSYSAVMFHYPVSHVGAPPATDLSRMALLSPHLGKVLELNRTMHSLRLKYNAVLSVLDRLDVAICILNSRGHAIHANLRARQLLDQRDGIRLDRSGRLACRTEDGTAAMLQAARNLSHTAIGEHNERSFEFEIERLSSDIPLFAIISPLRDADMELEHGLTGALLTIIEGDREIAPSVERACRAYRLTQAEARIAPHLARGLSNAEIAAILEIGVETAKSHVAAILSKTQSRSRLAFVWKVFQFSPPVL